MIGSLFHDLGGVGEGWVDDDDSRKGEAQQAGCNAIYGVTCRENLLMRHRHPSSMLQSF